MKKLLLLLLIAAPVSAQQPDSIRVEVSGEAVVPVPAPVVVDDPQVDTISVMLREHIADAALKPDATAAEIALAYAIMNDSDCPCGGGAPWWVDRLLIVGLGIGALVVLNQMERTTTINNWQTQETTVTTTVRRWDRKKKHGR